MRAEHINKKKVDELARIALAQAKEDKRERSREQLRIKQAKQDVLNRGLELTPSIPDPGTRCMNWKCQCIYETPLTKTRGKIKGWLQCPGCKTLWSCSSMTCGSDFGKYHVASCVAKSEITV